MSEDRLLVFADLADLGIPFVARSVRRMVRRGDFPAPVEISNRRIAWRERDVREWINSRPERGAGWRPRQAPDRVERA